MTDAEGESRVDRKRYEALLRRVADYDWIMDGVAVPPVVRRGRNQTTLTSEEFEVLARLIRKRGARVPFSEVKKVFGSMSDTTAEKRFNGARAKVEPFSGDKKETRASRSFGHEGALPDREYAFQPLGSLVFALIEPIRESPAATASAPTAATDKSAVVSLPPVGRPYLSAMVEEVFGPPLHLAFRDSEAPNADVRVHVETCQPYANEVVMLVTVENRGLEQQIIDRFELEVGDLSYGAHRAKRQRRRRRIRSKPEPLPTRNVAIAPGGIVQGLLAFARPESGGDAVVHARVLGDD